MKYVLDPMQKSGFRMLSERYRYPKATYAAKFAIIAGIVNLLAGF